MQNLFLGLPLAVMLALCVLVALTMVLAHVMVTLCKPAVVRPADEAVPQPGERSDA
jgi:hypothetical protein